MYLHDPRPGLLSWRGEFNFSVQSARPQQGWVQNIDTIRGSDHFDVFLQYIEVFDISKMPFFLYLLLRLINIAPQHTNNESQLTTYKQSIMMSFHSDLSYNYPTAHVCINIIITYYWLK